MQVALVVVLDPSVLAAAPVPPWLPDGKGVGPSVDEVVLRAVVVVMGDTPLASPVRVIRAGVVLRDVREGTARS